MYKTKKYLILIFILSLCGFFIWAVWVLNRRGGVDRVRVSSVSVDKEASFRESINKSDPFYALYGKARIAVAEKKYTSAIKFLEESIGYAKISIEKGMSYKKLAEIYRVQGDLEKELFYVEEWPKYSMNQQLNDEAKLRASEIRQILESHRTAAPPKP